MSIQGFVIRAQRSNPASPYVEISRWIASYPGFRRDSRNDEVSQYPYAIALSGTGERERERGESFCRIGGRRAARPLHHALQIPSPCRGGVQVRRSRAPDRGG